MKSYQFSSLHSINCDSFSKWIRLKGKPNSQWEKLRTDGYFLQGKLHKNGEDFWMAVSDLQKLIQTSVGMSASQSSPISLKKKALRELNETYCFSSFYYNVMRVCSELQDREFGNVKRKKEGRTKMKKSSSPSILHFTNWYRYHLL